MITLDANTQMPRDAVRRLVGAPAHPLNRPRYNAGQGRVVSGYGVLQPRISFHLAAATRSRFAALLAASGGIDPYSTATSDVFMDLFGVGSFTGKGIYDIDAFEAATGETFPENQILSHDLIEGNYARCGPASTIRSSSTISPPAITPMPDANSAGSAATGRVCPGSATTFRLAADGVPIRFRSWSVGSFSTTCRRSLVPPAFVLLLTLGWTVLPRISLALDGAALAIRCRSP